jgi:hypothetical protein
MTSTECVNKIQDHFPEKCSDTMILDLVNYIESQNLGPIQTEVFYNTIINNYEHQHRYFPTLKQVKYHWGSRHGTGGIESHDFDKYQERDCVEKTKHWSVERIVDGVNAIKAGGECNHEGCTGLCTTQLLIVKAWGELASIDGHLTDLNWTAIQKDNYLQKIKNEIIAGNPIHFDVTIHENNINITLDDDRDMVGKTSRPTKHIGELI